MLAMDSEIADIPVALPRASQPRGMSAQAFAYSYLKDLIFRSSIPSGVIFTEQSVCDAIEVSRTPVRAAIFRLESEELLEAVPRRGILIAPVTFRQLTELAEARALLEGHAARIICNRKLDTAAKLYPLIELQEQQLREDPDDLYRMIIADRRFHLTMVEAIGSKEIYRLYYSLQERQIRTGIYLFQTFPDRKESAIHHHTALADALAAHDTELSIRLIEKSLSSSLIGLDPDFSG